MMYETQSDLPVDGEIEYEKIPTGELEYNLGMEIFQEKFRGEVCNRYKTSDLEVDNVPAVRIWKMNDGRYFLKWNTVDNSGFEVFETSSDAEEELEFIVGEITD